MTQKTLIISTTIGLFLLNFNFKLDKAAFARYGIGTLKWHLYQLLEMWWPSKCTLCNNNHEAKEFAGFYMPIGEISENEVKWCNSTRSHLMTAILALVAKMVRKNSYYKKGEEL